MRPAPRKKRPVTCKCRVCGERKSFNTKNFRASFIYSKTQRSGACLKCKPVVPGSRRPFKPETTERKKCQNCGKEKLATKKFFRETVERIKGVRGTRPILSDTCKKCPQRRPGRPKPPVPAGTPSQPQQELASRILSKRKLIYFIKKFHPGYKDGWVHHDICRRLENFLRRVEAGEHPRLMLLVPPRHGKSRIGSQYFPAWVMGRHPDWEQVVASYNQDLPLGFSRNIRELIQLPEYRAMFPNVTISRDSRSAERWNTTRKGQFLAVGRGGGLSGKGYHIGIIDDPISNAEEADSERIRQGLWDWYSSTFYTRQHPSAGILVIQTCWHDDDLAGRLIAQMNALRKEGAPEEAIDNWEIVRYPAIAKTEEYINADGSITDAPLTPTSIHVRSKGDALHPDRYPLSFLYKTKNNIEPRHWSALYQQDPVPDEGAYFRETTFRYVEEAPPHHLLKVCIAADLAIGEREANDWTVFAVAGLDYNDQLFILDIVRFRGDAHRIVETALDLCAKYKPELLGFEKGQIEMAIMPQFRKRLRERQKEDRKAGRKPLSITLAEGDNALSANKDKQARARPLQGRMQQGMVYFTKTPWLEDLKHEFLRFPQSKWDDQVDAVAWVTTMLLKMDPPRKPKRKQSKSWKDKVKVLTGAVKDCMAA